MITWQAILGIILVIGGAISGWFVRGKKATSDQATAVDQAKTTTETQVRTQVATEAQASVEAAQDNAAQVRQTAEQVATSAASSGDDALNEVLRQQGMLRD